MGTTSLQVRVSPRTHFDQCIELFYTHCRALNYSPRTIDEFYRNEFRAFRRYLDEHHPDIAVGAITATLIRDFLSQRQLTRSSVTARHSWQVLSVWFKFLYAEGLLDSNPMEGVGKPKVRNVVMKTYAAGQVEALLASCDRKTFTGARDFALMLLLCDTGLRVSELTGLRIEDLDPGERIITVTMAKGNKQRQVPYGESTARALRQYLAKCAGVTNQPAVFINCYGEPLDRRYVLDIVKRHGEKAGLSRDQCGCHTFRRFFAVQFLRNGGDVFALQKMLGHTTLDMTRKYAELAQSDVVAKHRAFGPADRLNLPQPTSGRKRLR
ncbi:MAG TPA: tyrosine-type recombinase/integrase [Armatimonadota bacterium]|nr:tyrosine-type recombinase/integrase [Armatimonadota bacterium]